MVLLLVSAMLLAPPPSCPPSRLPFTALCEGADLQQYQGAPLQQLGTADENGNGLDAQDIELGQQRQLAKERANSLREVVTFDLDGDFAVDAAEFDRVASGKEQYSGYRKDELFRTYDANRDGRIDRDEIFHAPLPQEGLSYWEDLRNLLAIDPSRDGRLEADELARSLAQTFGEIDSDHDGKVSDKEASAEWERAKAMRAAILQPGHGGRVCAIPAVPRDALLAAFSTGRFPSSAQPAIDVVIEDGSQPLYLVIASDEPATWRFSGDVPRIAQVVLGAGYSSTPRSQPSHASGIAPDKVVLLPDKCLPRLSEPKSALRDLVGQVWRAAGRKPDAAEATAAVLSISMPSGRTVPLKSATQTVALVNICSPGSAAPLPDDFGAAGIQAQYSFVTQGAARQELRDFLQRVSDAGFSFMPITINLNGHDTMLVPGRKALTSAPEVANEFRAACALAKPGHIFLDHVQHNRTTDQSEWVRVR